eukprot:8753424-Pyramimonas_sp.AAC.1
MPETTILSEIAAAVNAIGGQLAPAQAQLPACKEEITAGIKKLGDRAAQLEKRMGRVESAQA